MSEKDTLEKDTSKKLDIDEINITWLNPGPGWDGHGVGFYHDDCGGIERMIAFIEGYDWMHDSLKHKKLKTIPVQIFKPEDEIFKECSIEGKVIINEVKEVIVSFLKHPKLQKDGKIKGKVLAQINA